MYYEKEEWQGFDTLAYSDVGDEAVFKEPSTRVNIADILFSSRILPRPARWAFCDDSKQVHLKRQLPRTAIQVLDMPRLSPSPTVPLSAQNTKIRQCDFVTAINMPGPTNTLLIEGSFEELADELALYIDDVRKKQNPENANVQAEIAPLLENGQKDEALKKLVTASDVLNTAPEKGGLGLGICIEAVC